jgi:hypothetical protein
MSLSTAASSHRNIVTNTTCCTSISRCIDHKYWDHVRAVHNTAIYELVMAAGLQLILLPLLCTLQYVCVCVTNITVSCTSTLV